MHPQSLKLFNMFNYVFFMDCTYKTNKFGMPYLNIVSLASTNQTFTVMGCFLKDEKAESYTWALEFLKRNAKKMPKKTVILTDKEAALINAITKVFPNSKHMLCKWHIEKNVLANCRGYFQSQDSFDVFYKCWTRLLESHSLDEYDRRRGDLMRQCNGKPNLMTYLNETWLCMKEAFVKCFTKHYMHFGHSTTSRVEGSHSIMKGVLDVATGDLLTVHSKLDPYFQQQYDQIAAQISRDRRIVKHAHDAVLFAELFGNIAQFALNSLQDVCDDIDESAVLEEECACEIKHSYGMPCCHDIAKARAEGRSLKPDEFHDLWVITDKVFDRVDAAPEKSCEIKERLEKVQRVFESSNEHRRRAILESLEKVLSVDFVAPENPEIATTRGRPKLEEKGTNVKSSTKREPSFFEHVFAKSKPKCSSCRKSGHNAK